MQTSKITANCLNQQEMNLNFFLIQTEQKAMVSEQVSIGQEEIPWQVELV